MAEILRSTKNEKSETIHTVRSKRDEEVLVNVDHLVKEWVDLMSDKRNEEHFGWTLDKPWFESALNTIDRAARADTDPVPQEKPNLPG